MLCVLYYKRRRRYFIRITVGKKNFLRRVGVSSARIASIHTPQSSSFLLCVIIIIISYTLRNLLFRARDKALPPLTLLSRTHSDIRRHIPTRRHPPFAPAIVFDLTCLVYSYFIIYRAFLLSQTRHKYLGKKLSASMVTWRVEGSQVVRTRHTQFLCHYIVDNISTL